MKILNFKLRIIFLSTIFYLLFAINSVSAQTTSLPANTNPDVPNNLHNWTQTVMIEVTSALSCQLTGIDPTKPGQQCLGVDQATGKIGFLPAGDTKNGQVGGAIGGMSSLISVLYTPPAHSGDYFRYLAENFGVTKKTYAQVPAGTTGTGFEGLRPLLNLWTAFRNIVYLIFVLVFVIIGIAIMLRVRIDPRTVMTIQNQIPKIIIGILLVTFSYAIAGFLIDLMYITIHIGGNLIVSTDPALANLPTNLSEDPSPFEAAGHAFGKKPSDSAGFGLWHIVQPSAEAVAETIVSFFGPFHGSIQEIFDVKKAEQGSFLDLLNPLNYYFGRFITEVTSDVVAFAFTALFGLLFGIIAFLIIAIALLFALFRLWFTLLKAYVMILIDVVLAPFWIIGSIVPGSSISATGWLRDIVSNLAAFPVTIFMLLLGRVFVDAFAKEKCLPTRFIPPLIGDRFDCESVGALIGLGFILMTPSVVNMLKAALKAPKVETGSIGQALKAGPGVVGGAYGTAMQGLNARYQFHMLNLGKKTAAPSAVPPPGGGGGHP